MLELSLFSANFFRMKILRRMILLVLFFPLTIYAEDNKERVTSYERMRNFGVVYGAQWATYVGLQWKTIDQKGSLKNWLNNSPSPHFDNDSFDYNIFQHSLSGSMYYLFYRSQRYTQTDAFLWSFISSAAFEFTIETVTERPSWQDLYQTPVYGTLLGIGVENISDYFYEKGNWWGKTLGYITNPFRFLKQEDKDSPKESFMPTFGNGSYGVVFMKEFE